MTQANKDTVTSRDGTTHGTTTGSTHSCQMEGCNGRRITTRWPEGKITHPCSKGMEFSEKTGWRIL